MFMIAPAGTFAIQTAATSYSEVGRLAGTPFFDDLDQVGSCIDWVPDGSPWRPRHIARQSN
jgi:hypothetical protein